jgi:16S rRNA C967 or C1407 C5-methylase (RsmB/RsmF family)
MSSVSATFPPDFTTAMREFLGSEAQDFFDAQTEAAPVSLRLNPQKLKLSDLLLNPTVNPDSSQTQFKPVPWSQNGFYLKERPVFTLDPRFHSGAYYVQDASCMLLGAALSQLPEWQHAKRVLDLCAAPGGKSTLLKSELPLSACMVSNEVVPARAKILKENLTKWGCDRVFISQNQPADFQALAHTFDIIVVDAPCSGEGLFRRQPEAIAEWSAQQVTFCAQRQEHIIQDIWPCLAEDGLLIYSTCTWNTEENEKLLQTLHQHLRFEVVSLHFPTEWGVHGKEGVYRCLPHRMQGEGFSLCVLKKTEAIRLQKPRREKKKQSQRRKKESTQALPQELKQWIEASSSASISEQDLIPTLNQILYWPAAQQPFLKDLQTHLREVQGAMPLATLKGKQWAPELPWLLSEVFTPNANLFTERPLDLEMALHYLYGEALPLSEHPLDPHSSGKKSPWQWTSFAGIPLGWVKQTPSHYNNYWPKSWKIRQRFLDIDAETNLRLCLPVEAVRPSDRL